MRRRLRHWRLRRLMRKATVWPEWNSRYDGEGSEWPDGVAQSFDASWYSPQDWR